jgi:4'-phosphopantetheinyl transferase EntD
MITGHPAPHELLPDGVVFHDIRGDVSLDVLLPPERDVAASFSERRRREYATVRHCARRGLSDLGLVNAAIVNDESGCPIWGESVVGSMTHCRGYRAAVVGPSALIAGIGIDAEVAEELPRGVLARISSVAEQDRVASLAHERADVPWDRVLFCVKESIFKAWYPLTRTGLGFLDVEVFLEADHSGQIRFLREVPAGLPEAWKVRWTVNDGIIIAAVWVGMPPSC